MKKNFLTPSLLIVSIVGIIAMLGLSQASAAYDDHFDGYNTVMANGLDDPYLSYSGYSDYQYDSPYSGEGSMMYDGSIDSTDQDSVEVTSQGPTEASGAVGTNGNIKANTMSSNANTVKPTSMRSSASIDSSSSIGRDGLKMETGSNIQGQVSSKNR